VTDDEYRDAFARYLRGEDGPVIGKITSIVEDERGLALGGFVPDEFAKMIADEVRGYSLDFNFNLRPYSALDGRPIAKARARFAGWRREIRWRMATAWAVLTRGDTGCD
jgi:hypothetical protein